MGCAAGWTYGRPGKVKYMIDCQPCVFMIHGGMAAATTANRPLARVNALVMSAPEDTAADQVVWMPAHNPSKRWASSGAAMVSGSPRLTSEGTPKPTDWQNLQSSSTGSTAQRSPYGSGYAKKHWTLRSGWHVPHGVPTTAKTHRTATLKPASGGRLPSRRR